MRRLALLSLTAVALSAMPALAQVTAITGGRVLTGTSVIENGTVVIDGGRILSVGTGAAPAGASALPDASSSGGESHPSALTEPDVKLSPHPALPFQPHGFTPSCHNTKSLGSRRAMHRSHCRDARFRYRNRLYFHRTHAARASLRCWRIRTHFVR